MADILVVDDDELVLISVGGVLEDLGHAVTLVSSTRGGRSCRYCCIHRDCPADARQPPRDTGRASGSHGRVDPWRLEAQHHSERGQDAAHRALVHGRGPDPAARRHSPDRYRHV